MKTRILKILVSILFFIIALEVNKTVNANSISEISMDIYVNKSGTASVTETWKCSTSQGTEVYHPYYNLGKSEIYNLTVSENLKQYTTLNYWNSSASLEQKAYKCGINEISNGVELCWGISQMGSHTYTVKYNISNFVANLTDAQMIYWTLIPYDFSNTIGHASVKIYTDTPISSTTDVWGYGKSGALCYVNNGSIYMDTDTSSLKASEYMTILAKFPTGTFNTNYNINKDFDYYLNMAKKGSKKYNKEPIVFTIIAILYIGFMFLLGWIKRTITKSSSIETNAVLIVLALLTVFTRNMIIFILLLVSILIRFLKMREIDYGKAGKRIPKDVAYYRDIPCEGNIFKAYYIATLYGLTKNKTDILGAIILSWLQKDIVEIEKTDGISIFNRESTNIILKQPKFILEVNQDKSKSFFYWCEVELYNMLYEASIDGILENKEFEKWCRKGYNQILNWFDKIQKDEKENLAKEGLLNIVNKKTIIRTKRKILCYTRIKRDSITISRTKKIFKRLFINTRKTINRSKII